MQITSSATHGLIPTFNIIPRLPLTYPLCLTYPNTVLFVRIARSLNTPSYRTYFMTCFTLLTSIAPLPISGGGLGYRVSRILVGVLIPVLTSTQFLALGKKI
ncbi:hypothetical protein GGR58DRAFT_455125 [Xylaria digitata]|nr:hypothetical protein GGR58DRAFT_455125 [Xylaria digitata]